MEPKQIVPGDSQGNGERTKCVDICVFSCVRKKTRVYIVYNLG